MASIYIAILRCPQQDDYDIDYGAIEGLRNGTVRTSGSIIKITNGFPSRTMALETP